MPPTPRAPLDFAEPAAADLALSARVLRRIAVACAKHGGHIGFDTFMEIALYSPAIGYYTAARPRFGAEGDFVTAPEISPRFADCIARAIAPALSSLAGAQVLEAGAGRGTLARGVLEALDALGIALHGYLILERSASARAEQAQVLGPLAARVRWLDDFPGPGFRGAVIANELLDAIPARRFVSTRDGPRELRVTLSANGLDWVQAPFDETPDRAELRRVLAPLDPLPEGYVSEFAPARGAWLRTLAQRVEAGLILLSDYGYPRAEYYHPQRGGGTLCCYHRHRSHDDPFRLPGVEDISVHVEFTAIAEAGVAAGLELAGFTSQAHFLMDAGVLHGMDDPALAEQQRVRSAHAIRRLLLPMEMGEAVKFMAFTRGLSVSLPGFGGRDMRHRL